ncbi:cysteine-rich venom protein-like [Watersipora subatra]|uniref:cysteine-rich venom protein-like n=1 Tax=Watersipora subatra TaxID=2589382 RepID=UPI00355BAE18
MTPTLREEIVSTHNSLRSTINASNMQKMVWDSELASLAQKWADNCEFDHDNKRRNIPGRFTVGQNLALGHHDWSEALHSWWNEIAEFTYNRQDMELEKVGHFTQMAWAESVKVGCGWANCTNMAPRLYVCNYSPGGNFEIWKPYEIANDQGDRSACSSCPNTCDRNYLCDCGGKACQNGGILDVNTCQCNCIKSFHTPNNCARKSIL